LIRAIDSFEAVGIDRLLITKIDEAATIGAVVSALHFAGKPVSYITFGQSVPDDLREAEPDHLVKAMLPDG
jgi:flagellar biosynthesis protein FlhF